MGVVVLGDTADSFFYHDTLMQAWDSCLADLYGLVHYPFRRR